MISKKDLVSAVAKEAELKKADAEKAVDAVMGIITKALVEGDKVHLVGFGTFEVRQREARNGTNPITGETIQIAASKVPSFKAGRSLKYAVNT